MSLHCICLFSSLLIFSLYSLSLPPLLTLSQLTYYFCVSLISALSYSLFCLLFCHCCSAHCFSSALSDFYISSWLLFSMIIVAYKYEVSGLFSCYSLFQICTVQKQTNLNLPVTAAFSPYRWWPLVPDQIYEPLFMVPLYVSISVL